MYKAGEDCFLLYSHFTGLQPSLICGNVGTGLVMSIKVYMPLEYHYLSLCYEFQSFFVFIYYLFYSDPI